jgi:glycosyltransferase involved in cell wall biosynthesis
VKAFFLLADTPRRRAALRAEPGAAERYLLYGLDQLAARGDAVAHNLERPGPPPAWARAADALARRVARRVGATWGDLAPALACLHEANRADVVLATIDRMGVPATLLARAGLLRAPLVYVSVGLPERLERLRGRVRRLQLSALSRAAAFVAYSEHEAAAIREALAPAGGPPVVFVPFGVDVDAFAPAAGTVPDVDVVSVGADPHRDHALLLRVAARRPEWRFRLVVAQAAARTLGPVPANVEVRVEAPFCEIPGLLAGARVVALPVVDNSYSGATTVLLQALAAARPVVVSRTAAIADGYGLADGENVRLAAPGDEAAFERALADLLADPAAAAALGARGRALAVERLGWDRYVEALRGILATAAAGRSGR